jgi:hypothetical protein
MRSWEFLTEKNQRGKLDKAKAATMNPAHEFASTADKLYDLNRAMMVAAVSDGKNKPKMDSESWIGRSNMSHPYTDVEHRMLHHAYDAVGCDMKDENNGWSREPDDTHKISPVKGFAGYKRK